MANQQPAGNSVLDLLIEHLRARDVALDGTERPAAILWTDPRSEWRPLIELMQSQVNELLVLGDYQPGAPTGPDIWLRCLEDGALEQPGLQEGCTPIIYLPDVSRQQLRAGPECPDGLQPLVELMFRGTVWMQTNGNDWSVTAFLTSSKALGLEIAGDHATHDALLRALREVAVTPTDQLHGRLLAADDFDRMLEVDMVRDLLSWMGDSAATRARLGDDRWGAFVSLCSDEMKFNPETEADVVAGERLGESKGPWAEVWNRFAMTPTVFGDITGLLRRSRPTGNLPFEREHWPDLNDEDEESLRKELARLPQLSHGDACEAVARLEKRHGVRRSWVWAGMDQSPMATVLEHLGRMASAVNVSLGGNTPADIAEAYNQRGWQADAASWEALAAAPVVDQAVVEDVVRHLHMPWLDASARSFQQAVDREPLPGAAELPLVTADDDMCVLFVDGLRFDLGKRLAERLEDRGCRVTVDYRWAALPTITATGKPAITPIADAISGDTLGENFAPRIGSQGKTATAPNLRTEMEARGFQILDAGSFDMPVSRPARGWVEAGDIDKLGHELGTGMARLLVGELDRIADRIHGLLEAGWESVRVVTDHGWLMVPGGLPKVDLPLHLTTSRWARCAVISEGAIPDVTRAPWHWNANEFFATAPGIACFKASETYVHGGLSVQECMTPDIRVELAGDKRDVASITSVTWRGLRCFVEAGIGHGPAVADLRLENPSGQSIVAATKQVEADGSVSLVLEDEEHEAGALVLVLLDESGRILTHRPTRVGEDS